MTSFSILRESIFIVLLGLASISFISLLSYDLSDPGFNTTGTNDLVNNYIGVFGAYFSSFLFFIFWFSKLFSTTTFSVNWDHLIKDAVSKIDRTLIAIRVVSFLVLLLFINAFFHSYWTRYSS